MYVVLTRTVTLSMRAVMSLFSLAGDYHQRDGNADTYAFLSQAFKVVIQPWLATRK